VTKYGRTAIVLIAVGAVALVIADAAAAKSKKHDAVQPVPDNRAVAPPNASGGEAKTSPLGSDVSEAGTKAANADTWSATEIADAKAHCTAVLQRIHAVYAVHDPIRNGACGAPAPIELFSIGQNPEVTFAPPPIVRCDLAEVLVNWLEKDLQPLARKHFGAPIVRIETMSDYSCRNALGRKTTRLSEHGLANAVDIGGFVMASAHSVSVLDDWGTTGRELAEAAEQKAQAEKLVAEAMPDEKAGKAGKTSGARLASSNKPPAGAKTGVPKVSPAGVPARLGGPAPDSGKTGPEKTLRQKVAAVARVGTSPGRDSDDQAFLREAHVAACRLFGTTLGPEANRDHRNHFHVDMAVRKFRKICD
jgi:hypothetical protein